MPFGTADPVARSRRNPRGKKPGIRLTCAIASIETMGCSIALGATAQSPAGSGGLGSRREKGGNVHPKTRRAIKIAPSTATQAWYKELNHMLSVISVAKHHDINSTVKIPG